MLLINLYAVCYVMCLKCSVSLNFDCIMKHHETSSCYWNCCCWWAFNLVLIFLIIFPHLVSNLDTNSAHFTHAIADQHAYYNFFRYYFQNPSNCTKCMSAGTISVNQFFFHPSSLYVHCINLLDNFYNICTKKSNGSSSANNFNEMEKPNNWFDVSLQRFFKFTIVYLFSFPFRFHRCFSFLWKVQKKSLN